MALNLDNLSEDQAGQIIIAMNGRKISDLSEDEAGKILSMIESKAAAPQDNSLGGKVKRGVVNTLDTVRRPLDYAGGLIRTGLADAISPEDKVTLSDWGEALKGNSPTSKEYLLRNGFQNTSLSDIAPQLYNDTGEGWQLQKGGWADPTKLGTYGLLLDTVSDPLTYGTIGLSAAGKAARASRLAQSAGLTGKAIKSAGTVLETAGKYTAPLEGFVNNPLEYTVTGARQGLQDAGRAIYDSGFKNIDSRLAEKGFSPVSPYMFEQGVWGGNKALHEGMMNRADELAAQRAKLYNYADKQGAVVNLDNAERNALNNLAEMSDLGYGKTAKAESLIDTLAQRPNMDREGGLSLQKASDIKTNLYDMLPSSAFDVNGRLTSEGKQMLRDLAYGYKNEIQTAANRAEYGLGGEIGNVNNEWAAILNANKPTQKEIMKAKNKDILTKVKAAAVTLSPKAAAAMYGAQFLNSPRFRTGTGLALDKIGNAGAGYAPLLAPMSEYARPITRRLYNDVLSD